LRRDRIELIEQRLVRRGRQRRRKHEALRGADAALAQIGDLIEALRRA